MFTGVIDGWSTWSCAAGRDDCMVSPNAPISGGEPFLKTSQAPSPARGVEGDGDNPLRGWQFAKGNPMSRRASCRSRERKKANRRAPCRQLGNSPSVRKGRDYNTWIALLCSALCSPHKVGCRKGEVEKREKKNQPHRDDIRDCWRRRVRKRPRR